MRKVKAKIIVSLLIDLDEEETVEDVVTEMNYEFITTTKSLILSSEIEDLTILR